MPEVKKALAVHERAEERAQESAKEIRWRGQAVLGRAILAEREANGTKVEVIAREIGRTREQVRRYQVAYRDWLKGHDGAEP